MISAQCAQLDLGLDAPDQSPHVRVATGDARKLNGGRQIGRLVEFDKGDELATYRRHARRGFFF